jgi:hypothetical protein
MGEASGEAGAGCAGDADGAEASPAGVEAQLNRVSSGSRQAARGTTESKSDLQKSDEGPTLSDRTLMRNDERGGS